MVQAVHQDKYYFSIKLSPSWTRLLTHFDLTILVAPLESHPSDRAQVLERAQTPLRAQLQSNPTKSLNIKPVR